MRANKRSSLFELLLSADEPRRLDRQVRPIKRPQRREIPGAELVQALRRGQVLEAVVAKFAQLRCRVEQLSRRLREENLPAVAGAHDPRRPMHVDSDVAFLRHDRLATV
jgi:hypothetical protein